MQVETIKAHKWQGVDRLPGDRYVVDPADPCVRGAQTLGLARVVESDEPAPRRRGRFKNRALTTSR